MKKCLAICKLENGVYQDGYAYFNYRELAKDLIDTYGPENFYEFPDARVKPQQGQCHFYWRDNQTSPSSSDVIDGHTLVVRMEDLYFHIRSVKSLVKSELCSIWDDEDEEYHSCNEDAPAVLQTQLQNGTNKGFTPAVSVEQQRAKRKQQDRSAKSAPYKTPHIASQGEVPPAISAGEKNLAVFAETHEQQQEADVEVIKRARSSSNFSTNSSSNSCSAGILHVPPPHTPPKCKEEDREMCQKLDDCWDYMRRVLGFRMEYGNDATLNTKDNQVYIIPHGRYRKGIEYVEYFPSRPSFVRHMKRNPCIIQDFAAIWSRLSALGWRKEYIGDSLRAKYLFPVSEKGYLLKRDIQAGISHHEDRGVHLFFSRVALHKFVLRYPYAMQEDAALVETLETQGWVSNAARNKFSYPRGHLFVTPEMKELKSLSLSQVRSFLWSDPAYLYADTIASGTTESLMKLRTVFTLPAEHNIADQEEEDLNKEERVVEFLCDYAEKCERRDWSHPCGDKGVSFVIPEKDVPVLEKKFEDLEWRVGVNDTNTKDWWHAEKSYQPNWDYSGVDLRIKRNKGLVPGLDIFWSLDDALQYITSFHNALPIDIEKGGVSPLRVDYTREDALSHILNRDSKGTTPLDIFQDVFPILQASGWRVVNMPITAFTGDVRVDRAVLPGWTDKDLSLDDWSRMVCNKDYFLHQQCVVKYLQIFANKPADKASYNKKSDKGNKFKEHHGALPLVPIPEVDSEGHVLESYRVEGKILNFIHNNAKAKYVKSDVLDLLVEKLGWKKHVRVKFSEYGVDYVILSPWGVHKMQSGEKMVRMYDYFTDADEVVQYVCQYGVHKSERALIDSQRGKVRGRERATTATDTQSVASASLASVTSRARARSKKQEEDSTSVTSTTAGVGKKRAAAATKAEQKQEEPWVDPYPHLSDEGAEGEIKKIFIDPGDTSLFTQILPYLDPLGWQFHVQTVAPYWPLRDLVTLPPWGVEMYHKNGGNYDQSMMMLCRDYFIENESIVDYLQRFGNKQCSDEEIIMLSSNGRSRRSTSISNTSSRGVRSAKNSVPAKSSVDSSFPVPTGPVRQKKAKTTKSSSTNKIPRDAPSKTAEYEINSSDFVTLSQVLNDLPNDPVPPLDPSCSREVTDLVRAASHWRPRLNLTRFCEVWGVLTPFKWSYKYLGAHQVFYRPGAEGISTKSIGDFKEGSDYFVGEEAVLAYIKGQFQARGLHFDTLVNRATYRPNDDFDDDNDYLAEEHDESDVMELTQDGCEDGLVSTKLPRQSLYNSDNHYGFVENFDGESMVSDLEYEDDVPSMPFGSTVCNQEELDASDEDEDAEEQSSIVSSQKTPRQSPSVRGRKSFENEGSGTKPTTRSASKRKAVESPDNTVDISVKRTCSFTRTDSTNVSLPVKESVPASPEVLGDVIARVRTKLQPSHFPSSVCGRDEEYRDMHTTIAQYLEDKTGGSIRVMGQSGQGKTLVTKHVLRALQKDAEVGEVPSFSMIWTNGKTHQDGFREFAKLFGEECASEEQAKTFLTDKLVKQPPRSASKSRRLSSLSEMHIIVIDEVDAISKSLHSTLLQAAKSDHSNFILIGLANSFEDSYSYSTEFVFEVYSTTAIEGILKCLTDGLFDEKAVRMIAMTVSNNADIRSMTALAASCLDRAVQALEDKCARTEDTAAVFEEATRSIVDIRIVNQCKKEYSSGASRKLGGQFSGLPSSSRNVLVALVLQFGIGQCFSLEQMQDAVNTHLEQMRIDRADMASVCDSCQHLVEAGLVHTSKACSRKGAGDLRVLMKYPQEPFLSIGISAQDLMDDCFDDLGVLAVKEIQNSIKRRNSE
mmetsp:Transcript_9988/g.15076  ORF Transcript_9988/g.15076 Transcript_9988/m.15076 type:complete len:1823 (-) Transcript_9988:255-5723(-)|eukprot:CAMPEP_0185023764 /NCGR_PEP_ID=MMETSP1103-20130426/6394_1 /TAXON_ID=36769 /ORGANISM="Paraphysomonas bandaiensis, Strain Caron Lab Isolate" /LENGTH=1822 /DNA_ID=CAMNT_0027556505 /DNA_START=57 /DNA_END=5525 /DNA_ORIENTATION=-